MSVDRQATLFDRLRDSDLLEANQLEELSRLPAAQDTDPRVLGKVVVQRGLLTRFQLNLVAHGKAPQLRIGPYLLLDKLGEGGMGQVFKARHRHMGRLVALKVIRKERLADEDAVRRFYQEAQAAGQLNHPNIVLAFDVGPAGNTHYLAMEFVEGHDLARQVKEAGPLPVALACEYARQAAVGLQHAHDKGLVHRDVKPHNLLVTQVAGKPLVKLMDLGLARLQQQRGEAGLTQTGQVMGTPDYLSPEQAVDARKADIRSDIYSLGCTLFYLLAARAPFTSETMTQVLLKHQMEDAPPLASFRSDVAAALQAVVSRMMAKRPEDRYQTPIDVARALEPFARGESVPVCLPVAEADPGGPGTDTTDTWATLADEKDKLIVRPTVRAGRSTTLPQETRGRPGDNTRLYLLIGAAAAAPVLTLMVLGLLLFLISRGEPGVQVNPGTEPTGENVVGLTVHGGTPAPAPWRQGVLEGHTAPVMVVAVSPDGKLAASAGNDRTVLVWDLTTGKPVHSFAGLDSPPRSLVFTEGGKRLLAAGPTGLVEWDLATKQVTGSLERSGQFLSPDGKTALVIAYMAEQKRVMARVYDVATGQERSLFPVVSNPGLAVSIALDGSRAAWIGTRSALQVYDLKTFRDLYQLNTGAGGPRPEAICCTPDARQALVSFSDGSVRLLDVAGAKEVRGFKGCHTGRVWALAVSPDGTRALSAGNDGAVRLWDVNTGQELGRFDGHTGLVRAVAFCGGAAGAVSAGQDKTVRVWDLSKPSFTPPADQSVVLRPVVLSPSAAPPPPIVSAKGQVRAFPGHRGAVLEVTFSPDGRRALSRDVLAVRLWELETGRMVHMFQGHQGAVVGMAVSKDWRRLVTAGEDRTLRIWDLESGAQTKLLSYPGGSIRCLAVSADGRHAVTGGGSARYTGGKEEVRDAVVRLWDLEQGKELHQHDSASKRPVVRVALVADGKRAVLGDDRNTWWIWDVEKRATLSRHTGPQVLGNGVAFLPGGTEVLVSAPDRSVGLWELGKPTPLRKLGGHKYPVPSIAVSADGQTALTADGSSTFRNGRWYTQDSVVRPWQIRTGKELGRFETPVASSSIALSPDRTRALTGGLDGTMWLWDLNQAMRVGGPPVAVPPAPKVTPPEPRFRGHQGAVNAVAFSPDGRYLLTGGEDGSVRLWDAETGKQLWADQGQRTPIRCVGFTANGPQMFASNAAGRARLWGVEKRDLVRTAVGGHGESAEGCLLTPDGGVFAVTAATRVVSHMMNSTVERRSSPDLGARVHALACPPDSRTLAVGDANGRVLLLEPRTLKEAAALPFPHKGAVLALAYTTKGTRLVSAGADKLIMVRDTRTGKVRRFSGHNGAVNALSVSPDARWLVSGSRDRTVRIWEMATGREVKLYSGHRDSVRGVAFDPRGKVVLSCGDDIREWPLPPEVAGKPPR